MFPEEEWGFSFGRPSFCWPLLCWCWSTALGSRSLSRSRSLLCCSTFTLFTGGPAGSLAGAGLFLLSPVEDDPRSLGTGRDDRCSEDEGPPDPCLWSAEELCLWSDEGVRLSGAEDPPPCLVSGGGGGGGFLCSDFMGGGNGGLSKCIFDVGLCKSLKSAGQASLETSGMKLFLADVEELWWPSRWAPRSELAVDVDVEAPAAVSFSFSRLSLYLFKSNTSIFGFLTEGDKEVSCLISCLISCNKNKTYLEWYSD